MTQSADDRLLSLTGSHWKPLKPVANYAAHLEVDGYLYISGQLPVGDSGKMHTGIVGKDVDLEFAVEAARICALNILLQIKDAVGTLENVVQVIKLGANVACSSDFVDHPKVANGASDLMVEILGSQGRHTRTAVGMSSLPLNATVEIDAIVKLKDQ